MRRLEQQTKRGHSLLSTLHAVHWRQRVRCRQLQRGHEVDSVLLPLLVLLPLFRLLLLLLLRRLRRWLRLLCWQVLIGSKGSGLAACRPSAGACRTHCSCGDTGCAGACS